MHCDSPETEEHIRGSYAWLACIGFSASEQLQLALWLEAIWKANKEAVPYGISFSGAGYFDRGLGKFVAGNTGSGLTCATFVMAVFADFEFPIVDWQTWPNRASDKVFQEEIVRILEERVREGKAAREHVDAQISALGIAPRFQPAEVVAAAGGYLGEPIPFPTAELLSRHLVMDLADAIPPRTARIAG